MKTETDVQNASRLALQNLGVTLWRNNSGVARELNDDGSTRYVRYGLGNDSENFNKIFKMGDTVGIMSGGIFIMVEFKKPGWRFMASDHEIAQLNAINFVNMRGGRAGFAVSPQDALDIATGQGMSVLRRLGALQ